MTSKEALERIKLHKYIKCEVCDETMLKGCCCCNNELKNSEETGIRKLMQTMPPVGVSNR